MAKATRLSTQSRFVQFFMAILSCVYSKLGQITCVGMEPEGRVCGQKKRHERFTVRAGRPVTQTTSSSKVACSTTSSLEYIQRNIESVESKYKNRNYFCSTSRQSFAAHEHQNPTFYLVRRLARRNRVRVSHGK